MQNKRKFFVTQSAVKKILEIIDVNKVFNIKIKPGGCNGFEYNFSIIEDDQDNGDCKDESDLDFDSAAFDENEQLTEKVSKKWYKLCIKKRPILTIDHSSLRVIENSTLDYTKELIGEKFVITNPQSKSNCSCGASFGL